MSYVRVVRFTDVDPEKIAEIKSRVDENDGPPEGVNSTGLKFLHDEAQGTMVVLQFFASAEDMEEGGKILSAMDTGDTPGTRASVDACEIKIERGA